MSDAFQNREKGFEAKYQLDQDQQFKVQSRRDRLFGQWLAGKLGVDAESYAKEVVAANFEKPGDDDLFDKVNKDLTAKGVSIPDAELKSRFSQCQDEATRQILGEAKKK